MRIWKLMPTNLTDPIWKKWSPEPIIIRAESEGSGLGKIEDDEDFSRHSRPADPREPVGRG